MNLNKPWHLKNKMQKNPALEEKIKWHTGHAQNCNCRDSKSHPLKLKQEKPSRKSRT